MLCFRSRVTDLPHDPEVQFALIDIDMGHFDADYVSQPKSVAAPMAGETVRFAVVAVEIVSQRIDVNQPLGGQLDPLGEQPKLLDAGDYRIQLAADLLGQKAKQLD